MLVGSLALLVPVGRVSAARPHRVGLLIGNGFPSMVNAFRQELRRLGYIEGQNMLLDVRETLPDQSRRNAEELAASGLDVVVAASLPQALTLRSIDPRLKMVIATAPGMVSNGFARSLTRPGGNVTGMDELPPGVTRTRLRLLKQLKPGLSWVGLLSTTPGKGGHEIQLREAEETARTLAISVQTYRATNPQELMAALESIRADGMEAFVNFQGGLSLGYRDHIVAFARQARLPAVYQSRLFVDAGGLMSYAPDQDEQYRHAARNVDRILKGASPGDLPVRYPKRYFLTVNRSAAAAIGMTLPAVIVKQAHQIIG